jgi:hypothetical protein
MKNENRRRAPLSSRWMGMVSGSPRLSDRPKMRLAYIAMNANVTSARVARLTTSPPRHAIRNANSAAFPHWPGDTQTALVPSIIHTSPKLVGLNRCLPRTRRRNLLAMVKTVVRIAMVALFVRSNKHSDRPEISALRGSKTASFRARVQAYCARSAPARISAARGALISKSSHTTPYTSRANRTAIW